MKKIATISPSAQAATSQTASKTLELTKAEVLAQAKAPLSVSMSGDKVVLSMTPVQFILLQGAAQESSIDIGHFWTENFGGAEGSFEDEEQLVEALKKEGFSLLANDIANKLKNPVSYITVTDV